MKIYLQRGVMLAAALVALSLCAFSAAAQLPVPVPTTPETLIPIAVDTAAPIIVNAIKPKPLPAGIVKFEGTVMNANATQITVRSKTNEMALQTFPLSQPASAKMQQIIDKGGYQYGDKVTVLYNTSNLVAVKVKGKPSRAL